MSKGPDAFRTISEVAEDLDLPQHVLRFWETRFAQIKPMKRGGGRRYYRPDDIDLLRGIRQLLYGEGYTIRGVQRILHEQGPRFVVSAGKGNLAALDAPRANNGNGHVPSDGEDGEDFIVRNGNGGNGRHEPHLTTKLLLADDDRPAEPTFDPRDFRPGDLDPDGVPHIASPAARDRLSREEIDRLKSTLADLLELKRLLDQSR